MTHQGVGVLWVSYRLHTQISSVHWQGHWVHKWISIWCSDVPTWKICKRKGEYSKWHSAHCCSCHTGHQLHAHVRKWMHLMTPTLHGLLQLGVMREIALWQNDMNSSGTLPFVLGVLCMWSCTLKWYKWVFWRLLEHAIINNFILFKQVIQPNLRLWTHKSSGWS